MMLPVAILAGGTATRLRPITETIPKAMVPVAGMPFISHQLRLLRRNGVDRVVLLVGYHGKQIEEFVGDGSDFGLHVTYKYDGKTLLGTGGALRAALPLLGPAFLVLYGDSYLEVPFAPVVDAWRESKLPALMTVFHNKNQFDRSNVIYKDGKIQLYDKALSGDPSMEHIDYGLGVLTADVIRELGSDGRFDLAVVYRDLARQKRLAGYEVHDRFFEIGTPEGLRQTEEHLFGQPN